MTHLTLQPLFVLTAVCLSIGPAYVIGRVPTNSDDATGTVGISLVGCANASVLTALPLNQPSLTVYTSAPEVRLEYPELEEAVRRSIMVDYGGDHLAFFQGNGLVEEDRPLYDETLVGGETRNFSHLFKYRQGGSDPLWRCGGCYFHALADRAPFSTSCPSNVTIVVPSFCNLTAFHVDWIEPRDVTVTAEGVSMTQMRDVVREGAAPGDAFVPGAHLISYRPGGNSDFESCNFTVRIEAFCEYSASVETIIGPMLFNRTLVGDSAPSIDRFCPSFFDDSLPRATAYCIYDDTRGPTWREPAEPTDCLQGTTIDDRFDLINMLLMGLIEMRQNNEPIDSETTREVALAIDAFTRLSRDNVENSDEFDRQIAELLGNLILLNDPSEEVTNIVLSIVNNFFTMEENDPRSSGGSNNDITRSLEEQAMNQIASGNNFTGIEENVALVNVVLNVTDSEAVSLSFGNFKVDPEEPDEEGVLRDLSEGNVTEIGERIDSPAADVLTSVSLPTNIQSFTTGGQLAVSFLLYRNGSLFQPSRRPVGSLGPRDRQVVGSQVVAATVYDITNMSRTFSENNQLVTTFALVGSAITEEGEELLPVRTCAFWNITEGGFWSTEGCRQDTNQSSRSRVACQCDHATNFAILVNVRQQSEVFTWISQLGSAISAFALLVTILSVLSIEKLRQRTPWQVHLSLMFALLGLYVVFLFGADQTRFRHLCIGISAAMHYFLLSAFMWMLMEGVLLYKTIVNANAVAALSHFTVKASLVSWGLPILPVIIPTVLRYSLSGSLKMEDFYELDSYCFLKPDSWIMYAGLLAIMAVILAVNLFFMVRVLMRLKDLRAGTDSHNRKVLVASVSITVLFGITWVVGFFAIRDAQYVVSIIFSALNGLQGFFIFLLFGVGEKEVRHLWAATLTCGRSEGKTGSGVGGDSKDTSDNSKKGKPEKSGSGTGTVSVSNGSRANPAFSVEEANEANEANVI